MSVTILAPGMEPGRTYVGTDETYDLNGMEFTLLTAETWGDLDSGIDQIKARVQVGAEEWDVTIPADAHVTILAEPYACAECGTTTAETYVVTTLDYADPEGTRTEVCRDCDDTLRTLALVTVNTGRYEFTTLAETIPAALVALREGYATHATQTDADPDLMAELVAAGEVNTAPLAPGGVLRDGAPIARTAAR